MSIVIYVDMDGVLARWNSDASLEETYLPGYFLARDPEPVVIGAIKLLKGMGMDVRILSSAYNNGYATVEKASWLEKNELGDLPRCFVPYGERKADYIDQDNINVLIDDYSKNLHEWKAEGNVGFKFYNGINGNHGTWHGYSVNYKMKAEEIAIMVSSIAKTHDQLANAG